MIRHSLSEKEMSMICVKNWRICLTDRIRLRNTEKEVPNIYAAVSAGMMWLTERSNCIRGHKKESDAGTDK